MDQADLDRELEKVKLSVFGGSNAAFLGSILCSVQFRWGDDHETAWTDGIELGWNPKDFIRCSKEERESTIKHELWHIAYLHGLRCGDKDRKIWNIAGDYRINNNLIQDGVQLPNNGWWVFDPEIDRPRVLAEEEIYELLMKKAIKMPLNPRYDLVEGKGDVDPAKAQQMVETVVRAVQAAKMANQAGTLPGDLKEMLKDFLEPVVPWRNVLYQWMTDLIDSDAFTWRKRNRRYQDLYMPSREQEEGRLLHLAFIEDTSGSITEEDRIRFNSEIKYVKDTLQPDKLTVVQFDTRITYTRVFTEDEPFEEIEIHGGGGTSLVPVRRWIEENEPTAAIIFSDLECDPMKPLKKQIPIIWAVIRNLNTKPSFGTTIQVVD